MILDVLGDLGRVFSQLLLSVVNELVCLVLEVDDALRLLVLFSHCLSFLHHSVDLGVGKTTGGLDSHVLLLASRFVFGGNVHNTVGVNVEGNLNLGVATGSHGNASEVEVSKLLVVLSEFTLTLKNCDTDLGLVISSRGESLGLFGGNGGVSGNETGKDTSHSLDTEG